MALLLTCAATALVALFAFRAHPFSAKTPTPLWSIDLAADKDFQKRLNFSEVLLSPPSLNFLSNSQLICDFYSGEMNGIYDSSSLPGYYVVEINLHSREIGRKLEFTVQENDFRTMAVADGGFLVLSHKDLQKFSGQFVPGASYATARVHGKEYFDRRFVDVAPGGQTALLYNHRLDDQQGSWTWLRTSDLTTIKSMQGPRTGLIRASDQAGIFYGTDDREMLLDGKTNVLCTRCDSHFLTNDLLFLAKEQSYAIQTVSGNEQGSGTLDIQAHNFARAAQATRFAYSTGHYVEHVFPIQTEFDSITCKIMVVDWKTNKPVAEIDINEPAGNPSAGLAQLALALSPDGQYLAVLLHQKVTLYRLPE